MTKSFGNTRNFFNFTLLVLNGLVSARDRHASILMNLPIANGFSAHPNKIETCIISGISYLANIGGGDDETFRSTKEMSSPFFFVDTML